MASLRRVRRNACIGKIRHKDKTSAVSALISLKKISKSNISVYKCKFCNGWHVGRSNSRYM